MESYSQERFYPLAFRLKLYQELSEIPGYKGRTEKDLAIKVDSIILQSISAEICSFVDRQVILSQESEEYQVRDCAYESLGNEHAKLYGLLCEPTKEGKDVLRIVVRECLYTIRAIGNLALQDKDVSKYLTIVHETISDILQTSITAFVSWEKGGLSLSALEGLSLAYETILASFDMFQAVHQKLGYFTDEDIEALRPVGDEESFLQDEMEDAIDYIRLITIDEVRNACLAEGKSIL